MTGEVNDRTTVEAPALTARDRARLRALTLCDETTIDRWWRHEDVRPATDERLASAARKLRIQRPARSPGAPSST